MLVSGRVVYFLGQGSEKIMTLQGGRFEPIVIDGEMHGAPKKMDKWPNINGYKWVSLVLFHPTYRSYNLTFMKNWFSRAHLLGHANMLR